jgi:hypothetical protein
MARLSLKEKISNLEARAKTLKARMAKQDRAKNTRRKILIGSLVLHHLEHSGDGEFQKPLADWLRRELPKFLTRDEDKAIFADLIGARNGANAPTETVESQPPEPDKIGN